MKIRTLEMRGIRQFSHKTLDFAEGLNIVYGPNESGKSTVLDSLLASVLKSTGMEIESLKQWDAAHAEIKLTYTAGGNTFTITRVLHPLEKDVLEGEGLSMSDPEEIQDTLEEHLGFADRTLFENSTVVKQNDMQILQEEGSRAKIRNRVRALISGVPERSTDDALEFMERSISTVESFLEDTEGQVTSMENELQQYKGIDEELKDLQTRLNVYEGDLERDQSLLLGYDIVLKYRETEAEYKNFIQVLETVENLEAYMRKLPIREKELVQQLQEELNRISVQQDKLIEKKRETREKLKDGKVKLSAIDDQLEEAAAEEENLIGKLGSLFGGSSRAKKEEMASRRVEISQNVARVEDLLDRCEEQISTWRRKFQEKGERLQNLMQQCGEYENWSAEMLEDKRKGYESKIQEILGEMTREELEENIRTKREETDNLRAKLVKNHPELKERKDIERISIEKEKLAEIIVEWQEKITGLKAQVELLSSRTKKRETLTEELRKLRKEREEKTLLMKADRIARDVISLVYLDLKEKFAPELEHRAERLLSRITQERYQDIIVRKEDLEVLVKSPEKNKPVDVEVLSQGTKDQLYLSLRIALSELLSGDKNPPLMFDEAFYTFDEDRLQETLKVLQEISRTTQVIVFTHDESYAAYGHPVPLK